MMDAQEWIERYGSAEAALVVALGQIRLLQEYLRLVQRFAQSTAVPDLFDATEESPR